jgi:solute carrier family 4 (anion exchanger) protein 1
MYSWVGCWTSLLLIGASFINASGLIRYCTRFTEEVFNALLAFNFLAEV